MNPVYIDNGLVQTYPLPKTRLDSLFEDEDFACDRYFLGEFEELNSNYLENKKLSYVQ
jgi:hypothetical protein